MSIIQQNQRNASVEPAEKKIKNRGWVKNATIVFLAVMLALTFFSNTFMNFSLPEVAQQQPLYSGIKSQIRGTGTVSANMTTDIKMIGTRTVKSVQVREGDKVEEGQVLFIFESSEDSGLAKLEDDLYEAEKEYTLYLLGAGTSAAKKAYDAKREEIKAEEEVTAEFRETLAEHQASLTRATTDGNILRDPLAAKENAANLIEDLTDEIAELDKQIANLKGDLTSSADVDAKAKAYYTARDALYALVADYRAKYIMEDTPIVGGYDQAVSSYVLGLRALYAKYEAGTEVIYATKLAEIRAIIKADDAAIEAYVAYYGALGTPNEKSLADAIENLEDIKSGLESQKKQAEKIKATAGKVITINEDIKKTEKSISESEKKVESLKKELPDLKKAVEVEEAKGEYSIVDYEKKIEDLKAEIAESEEKSGESEITAKVAGVITGITTVAGNEAKDGEVLARIEVVERGYTSSFSVTNQQAQQIRVGDEVTIENTWWQEIKATVTNIKNDTQKPGQNRIIELTITGDVSVGQTLDFVVGQRSTSYDAVLPKSAVREDNNGKFVLYIEAKQTPLSTRYYARRMDIQELASDDTNVAVSGLMGGEYIITTSTKPIEAGMQVRLSEK